MQERSRVLVTGGAGFIGAPLVRRLLAAGREVMVLDDLSAGRPLPPPAAGLTALRASILDRDALGRAMAAFRPEAVVHLAALHYIPACEADPRRAVETNILGTETVLEAAERAGTRHLVLASSGAVYAWSDHPLAESAALGPSDTYSLTKATNERQAALWSNRTGAGVFAARVFNTVGAGDPHGHLVPDLIGRLVRPGAASGVASVKLGASTPRRDYVHVEDVAEGLAAMALAPAAGFEAVNLCSGRQHSVAEVAESLAGLLGVAARFEFDPSLARRADRPSQCGDPHLAEARLGWRARRTLLDGLRDALEGHRRLEAALQ